MSLDWWEYYDFKGNLKTLNDEIAALTREIEKLKKEMAELKKGTKE